MYIVKTSDTKHVYMKIKYFKKTKNAYITLYKYVIHITEKFWYIPSLSIYILSLYSPSVFSQNQSTLQQIIYHAECKHNRLGEKIALISIMPKCYCRKHYVIRYKACWDFQLVPYALKNMDVRHSDWTWLVNAYTR